MFRLGGLVKDLIQIRILKFVRLPEKSITEKAEDLIEIAKFWVGEGFDGVAFSRCFCGSYCGKFKAYYLKCGHYEEEPHFIKVYNDYCPRCKAEMVKHGD